MADVIERYLLLGLRLDRHVAGFVDAYFGPPALKERAQNEALVEPLELADEARELREWLPEAWDEERRHWLAAQLDACETLARSLTGEELPWADLVERLYGVRPVRADERHLAEGRQLLDDALPGVGPVAERYDAWLKGQEVAREQIVPAAELIAETLRGRARALADLPDDESFELELVEDEPWAAYNYFLGARRSRVEINTDLPVWSHEIPALIAHELYPGHHTEAVVKEAQLIERRGWTEHSIFLALAPQSLLAEGIATLALEQALGDDAHYNAAELLRPLGLRYDPETATALRRADELVRPATVDAAFQLHEDGRPLDEAREYLLHWTQRPPAHVDKILGFVNHPTWRAYVATYVDGYRVCRAWVDGDDGRFSRLLSEPVLPGELVTN